MPSNHKHTYIHINTHNEKKNVKCLFDAMKSVKVLSSALFSKKKYLSLTFLQKKIAKKNIKKNNVLLYIDYKGTLVKIYKKNKSFH